MTKRAPAGEARNTSQKEVYQIYTKIISNIT